MRTKCVHPRTYKAIADKLAQIAGYKDHAAALAHCDPITGKIPLREAPYKEAK